MKKIAVYYEGWCERWLLGNLADDGKQMLFEYSKEAIRQGLELSPRHLKLTAEAYGGFPDYQFRLPGLVCDALPDGWGLLLMDRLFRQNGQEPAQLSPLDRLAFIGNRAMGALGFEPAADLPLSSQDVKLLELAKQAHAVVSGQDGHDGPILRQLALLGGSPQGARPKVLVHYHPASGRMSTQPFKGSAPWLVKFQAMTEHKEVCAVETLYAELAREYEIETPAVRHFDLDKKFAGFGIARFDVESGKRVPVHTLAGLLHSNFRVPSVDYSTFLRATSFLTQDQAEVNKAYERAVFNVVFHNRDDHAKNISYRLGQDRRWRLAPAYDLTFSQGPGGQHQMDVCGHGHNISRKHMREMAKRGGADEAFASNAIDRALDLADTLPRRAKDFTIRAATRKTICDAVKANREWLR